MNDKNIDNIHHQIIPEKRFITATVVFMVPWYYLWFSANYLARSQNLVTLSSIVFMPYGSLVITWLDHRTW